MSCSRHVHVHVFWVSSCIVLSSVCFAVTLFTYYTPAFTHPKPIHSHRYCYTTPTSAFPRNREQCKILFTLHSHSNVVIGMFCIEIYIRTCACTYSHSPFYSTCSFRDAFLWRSADLLGSELESRKCAFRASETHSTEIDALQQRRRSDQPNQFYSPSFLSQYQLAVDCHKTMLFVQRIWKSSYRTCALLPVTSGSRPSIPTRLPVASSTFGQTIVNHGKVHHPLFFDPQERHRSRRYALTPLCAHASARNLQFRAV
ncbi:hypothetical protein BD311DRAFT_753533 [Dichomitus squalens]|uniref:Uncharacterized protein n=1 Tax=Dichomitus squalens TaxID=114155 RepID=A0A4Q9MTH9_9APHY|nr:hypothetical protein BD311DRAFT_753533 [Dichomitus squalens]